MPVNRPDAASRLCDAFVVTSVLPLPLHGPLYCLESKDCISTRNTIRQRHNLQKTCLSIGSALLLFFFSGAVCKTFAQNATPYLPPQQDNVHDRSPYPYRAPPRELERTAFNPYTGGSSYSRPALRARPSLEQPITQPLADGSYRTPELQIDIHPRARNRAPISVREPLPLVTGQAGQADVIPAGRSSMISVRNAPLNRSYAPEPTVYLPQKPVVAAPVAPSYTPPPVAYAPPAAYTPPVSYTAQPISRPPTSVAVPVRPVVIPQSPPNMFPEHTAAPAEVAPPVATMPATLPPVPETIPAPSSPSNASVYVPPAPEPAGAKANPHITYYDPQRANGEPALDQPIDAVKVDPSQTPLKPQAAPPQAAPPVPEEPKHLTGETETILSHLPHDLFPATQTRQAKGGFGVSRTHSTTDIPKTKEFSASTSIGAKIAVKRQSIDVSYELEKAYNALLQGSTDVAVGIYKDVLAAEPNNKNALFGLATTYHKLGLLAQARPLYGRLLEMDPYNKEVLNNFLAMVGEEAPESAILYLEQLKGANHEFSPIYAQLAQLYAKQHDYANAIDNMQQATAISPENMVYKYNLAVLYDIHKDYRRAEVLYRQIIDSGLKGEDIPASTRDIQERLIYLGSK